MKRFVYGLVVVYPLFCLAQDPQDRMRMQLELNQGNNENMAVLELTGEQLALLSANPVKLNFADADELARLMVLDIFQISNLLQYREETGPIFSPYELMVVKGFDRELIESLLPFLDFSWQPLSRDLRWQDFRYMRHELVMRYHQTLEKRAGYKPGQQVSYSGPPFGSMLRYRGRVRDYLHIGIAAQNDPGESFGGEHNPAGTDHFSGFISFTGLGKLKQLILGDYQVAYGQGLALWSNGGFSGSGRFSQILRYGQGARPYAGSEENRYMRGIAFKLEPARKFRAELFISSKGIDAGILTDTSGNITGNTGSLLTTGLHRTASEIASKNSNRLSIFGGKLEWRNRQLGLKIYTVHYQLAKAIPKATGLYNQFRFAGRFLSNYGLEMRYFWRRYNLFGELAFDQNANMAYTAGVEAMLADGFKLGAGFRNFDLKYKSLFSAPPAVRGSAGESGIFLGMEWELASWCRLSLSIDRYYFKWISYRLDAPSEGSSSLMNLQFPINRYWRLNLSTRSRTDALNQSGEGPMKLITPRTRHYFRIDMRYQLTPLSWFSWRIEKSVVQRGYRLQGLIIYQDFGRQMPAAGLDLVFRIVLMDIPNFQARLYAYESDLLYRFSVPAYHGQAVRTYGRLKWKVTENMVLEAKASITRYFDRNQISSGLQAIEGNVISDIALQLRWKF